MSAAVFLLRGLETPRGLRGLDAWLSDTVSSLPSSLVVSLVDEALFLLAFVFFLCVFLLSLVCISARNI